MTYLNGLILSVVTVATTATAGAQTVTDAELTRDRLQGKWSVIARVCETSGNPARDAFVLGRDRMEILVAETNASLVTLIEGKDADTWNGSFNAEHAYLVMRPSVSSATNKRIAKVPFDLTHYPTLIITTGGFGEGGSCAPGESLKTYFRLNGAK